MRGCFHSSPRVATRTISVPSALQIPAIWILGSVSSSASVVSLHMAYSGPDITDIPGYRVGILFLLFLAILVVWSLALAGSKRLLRHRPGLLHITAVVQEEVLALGVISLALSALEVGGAVLELRPQPARRQGTTQYCWLSCRNL